MIGLGEHAEFIIAAYAGVFLGIAALIFCTIFAARHTKSRLKELGDAPRSGAAAE